MSVPFPIRVDLALDADLTADPSTWVWNTDISDRVLADEGVAVHRGRSDWQSQALSWCTLALNNSDGRFTRLNPSGIYYGRLRKNTPLRVSIDAGAGYVVRFTGFVSQWPVSWDSSEAVFKVQVRADGVLRRLGQGRSPLKSALRRKIMAPDPTLVLSDDLVAYWPIEDASGATSASSPISGVAPMVVSGDVAFGAVDAAAGSDLLPDFTGGGKLIGAVPTAGQSGTNWGLHCVAVGTDTPATVDLLTWTTTGTPISIWTLAITSGGTLQIHTGGSVLASGAVTFWDGRAHTIVAGADNDGADVILWLFIDGTLVATPLQATQTTGRLVTVTVNPSGATTGLSALGHISVYDTTMGAQPLQSTLEVALRGHVGDLSGTRFERLTDEELIPADITAGYDQAMGAQGIETLLELLREAEAAEAGLIVERKTSELGFDPHASRENISVGLALDYALRHLGQTPVPTDDDRLTRNDVTITRDGGSSAQVIDQIGPLGVDAVGRYDESLALNLETDDQVVHHAGWRVNLGTVNEYRYPSIVLNLHAAALASKRAAIAALDIGSRVTLDHLPSKLPPDLVDLIVEGIEDWTDGYVWNVGLICQPYAPYQIMTLATDSGDTSATLGHLDWDSCVTAEALDTTETGVDVTTTPLISTTADDFPFDIVIGGERMRVTACAGAGNPQTLTVIRSVNTVVKSHLTAAVVELHPSSARYLGL